MRPDAKFESIPGLRASQPRTPGGVLSLAIVAAIAMLTSCSPTSPEVRGADGDFTRLRQLMVKRQLMGPDRDIRDPRVLAAMRMVPRHEFVPENERHLAYEDSALPIGYGQTISQPYIVAFMTEQLNTKPSDRVL